jgi:release factor glutamine methyltransferase
MTSKSNIISELLTSASNKLSESPSPHLDAQLLLSFVSGLSKEKILTSGQEAMSDDVVRRFEELVARRASYEPVAYLTGKKEFCSLEFEVSKAVLIPRPETELLVELAIKEASTRTGIIRIADLGTGSGCVAISIASALKKSGLLASVWACDQSDAALTIAKKNARTHGVSDQITFVKSNWLSACRWGVDVFDVVVSNPPYVAEGATNVSPETSFEPRDALYSGTEGLSAIKDLLSTVPAFLANDGCFICEIGAEQRRGVRAIAKTLLESLSLNFYADLAGKDRAFVLR